MTNFIIIFIFLSLGVLSQRLISSSQSISDRLNKLVINVIIPAVIILNAPNLISDQSLLPLVYSPWIVLFICASFILVLSKAFNWDRSTTAVVLLLGTLGNTSFLGFPMVEALLGKKALQYAVVYDQVGNFLALSIFGTTIIAIYGQNTAQLSVKNIGMRIISFPPFIFLVITICLKSIQIEPSHYPIIVSVLNPITLLLTPVTMFIIGLNFTLKIDRHHKTAFCSGLIIKLVAAPIIMYIFASNLSTNTLMLQTLTLEAGMPPMVTAAALAMAANLERRLCASMVGIGLLVALITLPIIHILLTNFYL